MFTLEGRLLPGIAFGRERFVIEWWDRSPVGPISALLRYDPDGRCVVYSPAPAFVDLLRVWHRSHDLLRGDVQIRREGSRVLVDAAPLDAAPVHLELDIGRSVATLALNLTLALTLPVVRDHELFVAASGMLAVRLLGVGADRTFVGRTEQGVRICAAARKLEWVKGGRATIGGGDCGPLRPIDDPADWGALKMPRLPYLFDCRLSVRAPLPDFSGLAAPAAQGADPRKRPLESR